jgi:hypothetical protein
MRVLVACEFSGIVRDAFIAEGYEAVSCDLLPSERPGPHVQGDVREILCEGWDVVIAHPPCTYLANSGVRWRVERGEWKEVREAAQFFRLFLGCAPYWAIENPVIHGHAHLRKPDFTVQPWQFGDPEKKRVCFWTNLPKLVPTSDMSADDAQANVHRAPPGPDRWKDRSRFFPGLASAMAQQWGPTALRRQPNLVSP